MAKTNNILGLNGSIDNISFYNHKDYGPVVRKKGGPTKEQIESEPQFKETRGNITEFSYGSSLAKRIRTAFVTLCREEGDTSLHGRIAGRIKLALKNDIEHETGGRKLTPEGVSLLKDIPLHQGKKFDTNPVVRVVAKKGNKFDVHWLLAPADLKAFLPPEATHIVITSYAASVSLAINEYDTEEVNKAVFPLHNFTELSGIFSHKITPYKNGMIMLAIRIHFQMQSGKELYDLNSKDNRQAGFVYSALI